MIDVIATKLNKPLLPSTFVRNDLRVNTLNRGRVIVVSAQAGAGKSTTVSYWLEHQATPYIWYGLDRWDDDFFQFFTYFAKAIEPHRPLIAKQMLELLEAGSSILHDQWIQSFIVLLHGIKLPLILVFDDFHNITDPVILKMFNTLLLHMPEGLILCILTREVLPLQLARMRATNQLLEIDMSQLQFTYEETLHFLSSRLSITLSDTQLKNIYKRTEGWVAGLQLFAISLEVASDKNQVIEGLIQHSSHIMDYLHEEVLGQHDYNIRDFLLQSAILRDFSAPLCNFVLGRNQNDSQELIDYLLKTNSFLIALDAKNQWYRYHHLFKSLLLKRLEQTQGALIPELYRRAGEWHVNLQQYHEAMHYYLEGNCTAEAVSLLEYLWPQMDIDFRSGTWLEWTKQLPLSAIEARPVLCLGYGWALLDQGAVDKCVPWFDRVEHFLSSPERLADNTHNAHNTHNNHNSQIDISAYHLSAKAYIAAIEGRYSDLVQWTEQLEAHIQNFGHTSIQAHRFTWAITSFMGALHWGQGNLSAARMLLHKVWKSQQGKLSPIVLYSYLGLVVEIQILQGELTEARAQLEAAIAEVEKAQIAPILLASYYLHLAQIAVIQGERDQAFEYLEKSQSYGYRFESVDWRYKYYILQARIYLQEGMFEKAKAYLELEKPARFHKPVPEVFTTEVLVVWHLLMSEPESKMGVYHLNRAIKQLSKMDLHDEQSLPAYIDEQYWKAILLFCPLEHHLVPLETLCRQLLNRSVAQGRTIQIIEYTLLLRRFTKSDYKRQQLLERAQELAKPEGIVEPFEVFASDTHIGAKVPALSLKVIKERHNEELPEPLTIREMEILHLISKGYSNGEISNMLFIALSTVKSYNNVLFRKLEVKRRTEAVAKAQNLGLL